MGEAPAEHVNVSAAQFEALFAGLSCWGRWGEDDERGALHLITPERIAAAAAHVREGLTVSLSLPLNTRPAPDNPNPCDHHMTSAGAGPGRTHFNMDYVGIDYHHDGHSHIDALCHVGYDGSLYNGRTEVDTMTDQGAQAGTIEVLKHCLVGRGVLLDIPRAKGRDWLEPGEHIFRDDLEAAELAEGVRVAEGDILLVRTGHARRLDELGPWNTAVAKAGLHPTAMTFLAERGVAALGSDGNSDTAPSSTEGCDFPIHVLAITAMGIHLMDYLQFEDLRPVCERTDRWEFLLVAAPLVIVGGTGSPLNPIALF